MISETFGINPYLVDYYPASMKQKLLEHCYTRSSNAILDTHLSNIIFELKMANYEIKDKDKKILKLQERILIPEEVKTQIQKEEQDRHVKALFDAF